MTLSVIRHQVPGCYTVHQYSTFRHVMETDIHSLIVKTKICLTGQVTSSLHTTVAIWHFHCRVSLTFFCKAAWQWKWGLTYSGIFRVICAQLMLATFLSLSGPFGSKMCSTWYFLVKMSWQPCCSKYMTLISFVQSWLDYQHGSSTVICGSLYPPEWDDKSTCTVRQFIVRTHV